MSELTAENILRLKKRNDNRFFPDAVSATKQELLTFACNLIWSENDETEVLSGSGLPDTVKTWHMGKPSATIARKSIDQKDRQE